MPICSLCWGPNLKILTSPDGRKYIEATQSVGLSMNHQNKESWFRLTNKFYCGKERVDMNDAVSKLHQDAHWYVNAHRHVALTIRMYEDGAVEVLPNASYYPFTPLE